MRTCPKCGSHRVQRSSPRYGAGLGHHVLRSRFYCRKCQSQFGTGSAWVLPIFGASLVCFAAAVGAWFVSSADNGFARGVDVGEKLELARAADGSKDYRVALRHLEGDGVPQDAKEGVAWLERSAQQGYANAQYDLGVALRDGVGASADDQRALTWLRLAAEGGDPRAQFEVGLMYVAGKGGPADGGRGFA